MADDRLDPLLDPVLNWMFTSADHNMDIAAFELINAILGNAGQPLVSRITSLRSQLYGSEDNHVLHLELTAEKDDNRVLAIEVIFGDSEIVHERTIVNAAHQLNDLVLKVASLLEEALPIGRPYYPQVLGISFLRDELVPKEENFHQPMSIGHIGRPGSMTTDLMMFHNIELPKFQRLAKFDLDNPLQRWLYAMTEAYKDPVVLEKLRHMSPGLDAYIDRYEQALQDKSLIDAAFKAALEEAILRQEEIDRRLQDEELDIEKAAREREQKETALIAAQEVVLGHQEEYDRRQNLVKSYEQHLKQTLERGRIEQIRRMYENGYIERDVVEKELQDLGFSKEKALAERKKWDEEIELERGGSLTL